MTYEIGQLLWGAAKSVGNVWIVTDGPSRSIALLFDGKNKRFCPDKNLTKHDTIKPTSFLYEVTSTEFMVILGLSPLPQWAADLFLQRPIKTSVTNMHGLKPLPPAVVQKVQKLLGVNLTEGPEPVILRKDETKCPVSGGEHYYVPYTGLIQSFEFCTHCDRKRPSTALEVKHEHA